MKLLKSLAKSVIAFVLVAIGVTLACVVMNVVLILRLPTEIWYKFKD